LNKSLKNNYKKRIQSLNNHIASIKRNPGLTEDQKKYLKNNAQQEKARVLKLMKGR